MEINLRRTRVTYNSIDIEAFQVPRDIIEMLSFVIFNLILLNSLIQQNRNRISKLF